MSELVRIAINYLTRKKKHKLASAVSGEIERLNGDIENLVRARDYWSDAEKKAMQEAQRLKAENDHLTAEVTLLKMILKEAATNPAGEYYFGLHCGIEDNELMDRYEAADYGWDRAFEYVQSIVDSTASGSPCPHDNIENDGMCADCGEVTYDPEDLDDTAADSSRESELGDELENAIDAALHADEQGPFGSWSDYPIGTTAFHYGGGFWRKTNRGWQWNTGSTFPTPGGNVISVELPATADQRPTEEDDVD